MDRRVAASVLVAIFVLVGLANPAMAQASSDAVLILHFDEGSGTIVKDDSGHGNDGTIYGATWTTGISGKALRFDGVDDYVDCGNDASLNIIGDMSIEAWVYYSGFGDVDIINKVKFANGYGTYALGFENTKQTFVQSSDGSTWVTLIQVSNSYSTGWHHIAGTNDGTTARLYVDGVMIGTDTSPATSLVTIEEHVKIGEYKRRGDYRHFNGIIDEVAIYSKALTPEEIKAHYLAKKAGSPTTALSLTKTTSPHSIKQDQKTTVKITVENTGTTTIKDIEVVDTLPADFEFVSGDTSAKYGSLKSHESRTFQYTLRSGDTGKFDLGQATATYADEEGNYHTVKSNTPLVEVISSLEKPEIPTREETKGTPGFKAVFAVVGLLAVVYVMERRK